MKNDANEGKQSTVIPFLRSGEYCYEKGLQAYRKRDLVRAKKQLQRAVELEPEEALFLCQYAIVLSELGEYQAANEHYERIIYELDPEMTECFYFMANNFAHLGLFQEARKYANYYLDEQPDGEFAEDTEELLDIIDIETDGEAMDDEDILIMQQEEARNLLEQEKFREAIDLLEKMVQEHPEFWAAHNNLALAYFYMGNIPTALRIIDDVLTKNEGNIHALCNLLVFHYYLQNDEIVERLCADLEKVYPILMEHRHRLGTTFSLIGRYDLAYRWLRQLHKQGYEGDAGFYYWLSYAAFHAGNNQLAHAMWKKALEMNPDRGGVAPWMATRETNVDEIHHLLKSARAVDRLVGAFLLSQMYGFEELYEMESFQKLLEGDYFESQFVMQCLNATVNQYPKQQTEASVAFEVMQRLFECAMDQERRLELLIEALQLMMISIDRDEEITNIDGWCAGYHYVWSMYHADKVSQQSMATRYGCSVSTVSKYVKHVHTLLEEV